MTGILNLLLAAGGVVKDTYFNLVTLLLPGNGTNGTQNNTFLDSSSNNFPITRNPSTGPNAPTQGTFTPFSQTGWSNYLSSSNYLTSTTGGSLDSGDFTIEFWVYANSWTTYGACIENTNAGRYQIGFTGTNQIGFYLNPSFIVTSSANTAPLNQWLHVAICRSGSGANNISLWINGGNRVQGTSTTNFSDDGLRIGQSFDNFALNGYISNLRIVKGAALYSGTTFTPPSSPIGTAGSGTTTLLTCQNNRFLNNGSTSVTFSTTGTPSVQAFSPFAPSGAYTTTAVGGSGYFDGTGDYLTVADNAALELAASNFTIETWVYPTTTSGTRSVVSKRSSGAVYGGYDMFITTGNILGFVADDNTTLPWAVEITTGSTVVPNAWNHIAVTRNGSTWTTWVNGVQSATATASITINDQATSVGIGGVANGDQLFTGYICDTRIVKGTAVYTGTFTPPRAPISTSGSASASAYASTTNINTSFAASETSLLLNFTNAGITDATAKNDLETVGNAQISTTQSKFGGSSMSFDGTGDYLISNPATTDLYVFGSGDFTIEMWLRLNSVTGTQVFYDQRPLAGGVYPTLYMSGSTLFYYTNGANRITGATLSTGQWYHIAVSRSGTSTRLFVDGTQSGSTYTDTNVYLNASLRPFIGGDGTNLGINGVNGYIDDLRITKGFARYTANFNVPTIAFPTQ